MIEHEKSWCRLVKALKRWSEDRVIRLKRLFAMAFREERTKALHLSPFECITENESWV